MALQTALEKLKKKRDEYDGALKEITREKIAQELGPLIPEGYVVAWTAYIPSFNDGDPCTYRMGEVYLAPIAKPEDDEDAENFEDSASNYTDVDGKEHVFSLDWGDPSTEDLHAAGITKKAFAELKRAWKAIPEYVVESAFGPDVAVAVKSDGSLLVEDYYCGY